MIGKPGLTENLSWMRVDIHEDVSGYEIIADLPGVKKEDISIILQNEILTISASKATESEVKKKGKVIRHEPSSGNFTRSFPVSHGAWQDNIKANFGKGMLTLVNPKITKEEASDVRKINIEWRTITNRKNQWLLLY